MKSDAAKSAAMGCGYDFINNPTNEGEFLDRTRAKARASENAIRTQRGEEAYKDILEKKVCQGCGNPQAYDEMIQKKDCSNCGGKFKLGKSWADVGRGFSKRMAEDQRKREAKQKALLEETRVKKNPTTTQLRYQERVAQKAGGGFQQRMALDAKKRRSGATEERNYLVKLKVVRAHAQAPLQPTGRVLGEALEMHCEHACTIQYFGERRTGHRQQAHCVIHKILFNIISRRNINLVAIEALPHVTVIHGYTISKVTGFLVPDPKFISSMGVWDNTIPC
jgi:hypothetical protein